MAIIYSYPLVFPSVSDLILGTNTSKTIDGTIRNTTVNFTVQSLLSLVSDVTGAQNLQQVTNLGATTTNTVSMSNLIVSGTINNKGPFEDSLGSTGSIGKFLESTTNGTRWATNSSNNYSWIVRDSQIVAVNKTLSGGQFLKLTTIYGSSTPDVTTLTGTGSDLDPYLMTIPDTNYWTLRNTSTPGINNINKDALANNNTIPVLTNGGSGYTPGTFQFSLEASSDSMQLNAYVGADGVINSLTIFKFGIPKYVDGETFSITAVGGGGGIVTLNVIGRQGILVQTTPLTLDPFISPNTKPVQTGVFDGYGNNQQNTNQGVFGNLESSCDATRNQYANTLTLRATINPTAVQDVQFSNPLNTSGWTIPSINNNTATTSSGNGVNLVIRFDIKYVGSVLQTSASIDWPGQGYQDGEIVTLVGGNNLTTLVVTTNGGATQISTGPEMKFFGQRGGKNSGLSVYPNQRNNSFAKMATIKASAEQDFDSILDKNNDLNRSPSSLIFSTARFTSTSATTGTTSMAQVLKLFSTGQAQLNNYGSGNFTGTPTFNLSTTSIGNVIETPLYTWVARDSTNSDKTLSVGQYLKFQTAVGTPGATTLSGTGTSISPYLMTITSPDTNYTAGTGLTLNTLEFDVNVDTTVQTVQPLAVTATPSRTYAVQVDDTNDNLVVNVPWVDGGGSYVLPSATVAALGGVRLFNGTVNDVAPETITTTANRNYAVELSTANKMLVNVPWTDTSYTLPLAADGTRGGVQIGYIESGKNYPVELSSEKMFVNVPWTDTIGITGNGTQFTLPIWDTAAGTNLGNSIVTQNSTVTLSVTGTGPGTIPDLTVVNTGDSNYGSRITLYHNSVSPANNDQVGQIYFQGKDSAGGIETFASISGYAQNVSSTNEEGFLSFNTRTSTAQNTNTQKMKIGNNGSIQFNLYGSGNKTGTAAYNLSVDSIGNIIETANNPGGGLVSKIATNSFDATTLFSGGTLNFQLPNSVPVGKQLLIQDCVFYLDHGGTSFNYGNTAIIQLKFNDGSTFSQSLVLASTQSFMNGTSDNMQQASQPGVFFPVLYGDIVIAGGGTMQIVLPSSSGLAPTQGNGELYCSIKYTEIGTGISFGL